VGWRPVSPPPLSRRVVAVGTTMVRLLEELDRGVRQTEISAGEGAAGAEVVRGRTCLFITPGYEFRMVDGIVTNFHLPRTSLLALVMAFCGVAEVRRIYDHAIARRYRFYSFGDAMLAWGRGDR
jgi:S-adenosylmethionine:tRNA ribosyltransferase-isomerase